MAAILAALAVQGSAAGIVKPTLVDFASAVVSATLDPYDTVQYWWLGNCFASKCYDGNTAAQATQNCGSNTTNICHTGYATQVMRGGCERRHPVGDTAWRCVFGDGHRLWRC